MSTMSPVLPGGQRSVPHQYSRRVQLLGKCFILLVFTPVILLVAFLIGNWRTEGSLIEGARTTRHSLYTYTVRAALDASPMSFRERVGDMHPWPARDLRPSAMNQKMLMPKGVEPGLYAYNAWGVRDWERTVKTPEGKKRIVFIGDSFLDGGFCPYPVPALTELTLRDKFGESGVECVNLGISGTDPDQYYFRLRNVALELDPDGIFVFIYMGNDMIQRALNLSTPPPTEPPSNRAQVRGYRNMQNLAQLGSPQAAIDELVDINHDMNPGMDMERVREVLGRNKTELWRDITRSNDTGYMQPWIMEGILSCEMGSFDPRAHEEGYRRRVPATLTWFQAMADDCKRANVPFTIFICPVGTVDPEYNVFWKAWPKSFGRDMERLCEKDLVKALHTAGVDTVNLAECLDGVPETYRATDGHWNRKGHKIVALRTADEIKKRFIDQKTLATR